MYKSQHTEKDKYRTNVKLSDLKWSNLHPKAKRAMVTLGFSIFILTLLCMRLLSGITITIPSISAPLDIHSAYDLKLIIYDIQAILVVIGYIIMLVLMSKLMFRDCPLTPYGKSKEPIGDPRSFLKILDEVGTAYANKGSGNSFTKIYDAAVDAFPDVSDTKTQIQVESNEEKYSGYKK